MNFSAIWHLLLQLIGGLPHLTDPASWKVSRDGAASGPVTAVSFTATDVKMTSTEGGQDLVLEAKPGNVQHADIFVNGVKQDAARVVVAIKSQFPAKPIIAVLVFKHIQINGGIHDFRFDNPK